MNRDILTRLEVSMARRIAALPKPLRPRFDTISTEPRGLLITGPRGTGKSTFILSKLQSRHALYVSADVPIVSEVPLYDLASFAFSQGYEGIAVDEAHYAKDWSLQIKAIYDDFPERFIWASDSSSLVLRSGNVDLSRRFINARVPGQLPHSQIGSALIVFGLGDRGGKNCTRCCS